MPKRGVIKVNPSKFHVQRYCDKCGYKWVSQKSRHGNFPARNPKCPKCLKYTGFYPESSNYPSEGSLVEESKVPKVASPTPNSTNPYQFLGFELRFFMIRIYLSIGKS